MEANSILHRAGRAETGTEGGCLLYHPSQANFGFKCELCWKKSPTMAHAQGFLVIGSFDLEVFVHLSLCHWLFQMVYELR